MNNKIIPPVVAPAGSDSDVDPDSKVGRTLQSQGAIWMEAVYREATTNRKSL